MYQTPLSHSALFPLLLLSLTSQKHSPGCSEKINDEYDYIIVGGGTAGSVVAGRLSENPCVSVLVLEAGSKPPLISEVPGLSMSLLGTDVDWKFTIVPQKRVATGMKNKVEILHGSDYTEANLMSLNPIVECINLPVLLYINIQIMH